ncbi:hypothetical protein C8R47DRAFT_334718 [Mycena vitilis]|nr:hypothetical protein C8R47DRAFT_334718 [Mycena vitilis]
MYDDSSTTDTESLSTGVSLASLLGIRDGLRIRHHSASQKAHVVLRRVESSEVGQNNDVVYFKLFANKQISLKAGKELLLTIASVDGQFKDQPVMLEGDIKGLDDDSDHEGTTQVEEEPQVIEEEEETIPQAAMPPKMRRQWTKKVEEVSPFEFRVPVAHTSVGVQAQPIVYTSCSVQATASHNSVSTQVQPSRRIEGVQTVSSHTASLAVQTDPPPLPSYTSLDIQTDPILPSVESTSIGRTIPNERFENVSSLSPMQLSPPDSPSVMVSPLSIQIPGRREPSENMQSSPIEVKMEDIEATIPSLYHGLVQVKQEPPSDTFLQLKQEDRPLVLTSYLPRPVMDMFDLEEKPERPSAPSRISRPPSRNCFVSGGFVTDFVGALLPSKEAPQSKAPLITRIGGVLETSSCKLELPLTPPAEPRTNVHNNFGSNRILTERRTERRPLRRTETETQNPATSPSHRPRTARTAAASSSKTMTSLSTPAPPPLPSTDTPPRAVTLTNRIKEPVVVGKQRQNHVDIDNPPPPSTTPPPEPKAVARIPAGPSSNPLGIRPSSSFPPPVPARPAAPAVGAKAKKRVIVGRGWPFVRAAATPTVPATSAASQSLSKPIPVSILGHLSPAPVPVPVSKWKRIDSEVSILISRGEVVDMDISESPSPVSGSLPLPTTSENAPTSGKSILSCRSFCFFVPFFRSVSSYFSQCRRTA